MSNSKKFSPVKPAKIAGAGRKSKYVAFAITGDQMIVAEFKKVDGKGIHVVALDDQEKITLDESHPVWYIDPDKATQWAKDSKKGINWEFGDEKSVKVETKSTKVAEIEESDEDDLDLEEGIKIRPDHKRYTKASYLTKSGRAGYISTQDSVGSDYLFGLQTREEWAEKVMEVANEHGVQEFGRGKNAWAATKQNILDRYKGLNNGLQRMNCGNLIRGMINE